MVNGREMQVGDKKEGVTDKCGLMTSKCPSTQQDNPFFLKIPLSGKAFATRLLAPVL